jgi:hypothetical protein
MKLIKIDQQRVPILEKMKNYGYLYLLSHFTLQLILHLFDQNCMTFELAYVASIFKC